MLKAVAIDIQFNYEILIRK